MQISNRNFYEIFKKSFHLLVPRIELGDLSRISHMMFDVTTHNFFSLLLGGFLFVAAIFARLRAAQGHVANLVGQASNGHRGLDPAWPKKLAYDLAQTSFFFTKSQLKLGKKSWPTAI